MTNEKSQSRGDGPSEGHQHTTPTAMAEPAGSAHSPLPWRAVADRWNCSSGRTNEEMVRNIYSDSGEWHVCEVWGDTEGSEMNELGIANAEFIVRCVNAHEELIAALKDAVRWMNDRRELAEIVPEIGRALDALAKVTR
jgi:hypothetical protein